MRAGRLFAVLAVAIVGLGLFSAGALAGGKKKKPPTVIYFSGYPKFNNSGKVSVKGSLNTVKACRVSRGIRLQLLDSTATVISTLAGSSTRLERELLDLGRAAEWAASRHQLGSGQGAQGDRREVRLQGGRLDAGSGSG